MKHRILHAWIIPALALLLIPGLAGPAAAQSSPQMRSIFPAGARQGAEVELTVIGFDLEGVAGLQASHAGIRLSGPIVDATDFSQRRTRENPLKIKFKVSIDAAVPPGTHELRLLGGAGLSNPRAFVIGDQPEIAAADKHDAPDRAQAIDLETVVNGFSVPGAAHHYSFQAAKGATVVAHCRAQRLDSRMEPLLSILDASGRILASGRQGAWGDPVLPFTPPADGRYVLKVHDLTYRGGDDYAYRLCITHRPHIQFIDPPAGQAGATGQFTVYGWNLPGGRPAELGDDLQKLSVSIALPAMDEAERGQAAPWDSPIWLGSAMESRVHAWRLNSPSGLSNPVSIDLLPIAAIRETEPSNDPQRALMLSAESELIGRFDAPGDIDWFAFKATRGQRLAIEVRSEALGLRTDPSLLIMFVNDKGEQELVAEVDDGPGAAGPRGFDLSSRDPAHLFIAPRTGTYRLMIRDLAGSNAGPGNFYRLSIRRPMADFSLLAASLAPPKKDDGNRIDMASPRLSPGAAWPVRVFVQRRDGFEGDIEISARDLPPGVRCPPVMAGPGADSVSLIFEAEPGAKPWAGSVRIIGAARSEGKSIERAARGAAMLWPVRDMLKEISRSRPTADVGLAIGHAAAPPVIVQAGDGKPVMGAIGGKIKIPVKITRQEGFAGPVRLYPEGLVTARRGGGGERPEFTIPAGQNQTIVELELRSRGNENERLRAGHATLHIRAEVDMKQAVDPALLENAKKLKQEADQKASDLDKAAKKSKEAVDQVVAELRVATVEERRAADKLQTAKSSKDEAKITAAQEAHAQAAAKLKLAQEKQTTARPAAEKAAEAVKQAAGERMAAENRLRFYEERGRGSDNRMPIAHFYSPVIPVIIRDAPVELTLDRELAAHPGQKMELPVKLAWLLDFNDAVDLELIAPKGESKFSAKRVKIEKNNPQGTLAFQVPADFEPGIYRLILRARMKYNGQNIEADQPVDLIVSPGGDGKV